jgi:hypothetical protein
MTIFVVGEMTIFVVDIPRNVPTGVVFPTLLYKCRTAKVLLSVHKWPSLRLVRNPSERFQAYRQAGMTIMSKKSSATCQVQ